MKTASAKATWLDETGVRLDASYHLSEGRQAKIRVERSPYGWKELGRVSERIFNGARFKRYYVENPERGIPFMGNADMLKADFSALKRVSKVKTYNLNELWLKHGWTLISCSGTIGNTVYSTEDFVGKTASQHIMRVVPNEKEILGGYLYAFLTSKYGAGLLTQGTYGGVIQHIEPHHVFGLPVPLLPEDLMLEVHQKIEQAAQLRASANTALRVAVELLENELPVFEQTSQYLAKASSFANQRLRFDATVQHTAYDRFLKQASQYATLKTVGSVSARVFTPDIFKRIRVADPKRGVVFLSGTDLLETRPKFDSFLSRKTPKLRDYILEEGWLALQDSGSLSSMGYVSIVPKFLEGTAATNNLIRIVPKADNYNPYLFAYFKTKQGQAILKSLSYGTGQIHIDNAQIEQLQVPVYEKLVGEVTRHITDYTRQFNQAYELETSAISLVESAVTSWQ
jgi:type I restriction enzyme S subunit